MSIAQAMVYSSDELTRNPAVALVAGKQALVLVTVTGSTSGLSRPQGVLRVRDSGGAEVAQSALTLPTDATLPTATVTAPGFARMYSATIPAQHVQPGFSVRVELAAGQLAKDVKPNVGSSNPIRLVAVPITIGFETGPIYATLARDLEQRAPVTVRQVINHAPFKSTRVLALPRTSAEWDSAMVQLVSELDALRRTEGVTTGEHYVGFTSQAIYGTVGMAPLGGNTAVVAGKISPDTLISTLVHEMGHNFNLRHAPCGGPEDVDPAYPYANATLGAAGHFVWGYVQDARSFLDPTNLAMHDVMAYCTDYGTFSDYNYQGIQFGGVRPLAAAAPRALSASTAPAVQEVVMIHGLIAPSGVSLQPVKRFEGTPDLPVARGPYAVRLTTDQGTVEHLLDVQAIDHVEGHLLFNLVLADPGAIRRLQVLRRGEVLLDRSADAGEAVGSAGAKPLAAGAPQVTATERAGELAVRWDAAHHRYLSVRHIGGGKATTLALDLEGGSARLPVSSLPAGGSFEYMLSDGLGAVRVVRPR